MSYMENSEKILRPEEYNSAMREGTLAASLSILLAVFGVSLVAFGVQYLLGNMPILSQGRVDVFRGLRVISSELGPGNSGIALTVFSAIAIAVTVSTGSSMQRLQSLHKSYSDGSNVDSSIIRVFSTAQYMSFASAILCIFTAAGSLLLSVALWASGGWQVEASLASFLTLFLMFECVRFRTLVSDSAQLIMQRTRKDVDFVKSHLGPIDEISPKVYYISWVAYVSLVALAGFLVPGDLGLGMTLFILLSQLIFIQIVDIYVAAMINSSICVKYPVRRSNLLTTLAFVIMFAVVNTLLFAIAFLVERREYSVGEQLSWVPILLVWIIILIKIFGGFRRGPFRRVGADFLISLLNLAPHLVLKRWTVALASLTGGLLMLIPLGFLLALSSEPAVGMLILFVSLLSVASAMLSRWSPSGLRGVLVVATIFYFSLEVLMFTRVWAYFDSGYIALFVSMLWLGIYGVCCCSILFSKTLDPAANIGSPKEILKFIFVYSFTTSIDMFRLHRAQAYLRRVTSMGISV